jgi:hypothetical protein
MDWREMPCSLRLSMRGAAGLPDAEVATLPALVVESVMGSPARC